jgi:hypothetical protein
MPSNFNEYDKNAWDNIKPFFHEFKRVIDPFVRKFDLKVDDNNHNWPSIGLEWYQNEIRKYIQLWLEDGKNNTYTFWICASFKDKWKNKYLFKNMPFEEAIKILNAKTEEAYTLLSQWNLADLENK